MHNKSKPLSHDEIGRYSRQILVKNFGGPAQQKLKNASVAIIGLGGIGAPLSLYLTASGIGRLDIFEYDEVNLSNLQRQVLYSENDIHQPKTELALARLHALNSHTEIRAFGALSGKSELNASLIIDGSDNFATRHLASRLAHKFQIPLMSASLAQWEGQIGLFHSRQKAGCYHCLYPEDIDISQIPNCSEAGVIGAFAGMIGTMTSLEAIKYLTNIEPMPYSQIRIIDGLYNDSRQFFVKPVANCPICSEK